MILTDRVVELTEGLLQAEVEATDVAYSMFNTGSVEIETAEFLYGLVRMMKPVRILSTGAHKGVSDLYMALAVEDNGFGQITAIEYEPQHVSTSKGLWEVAGIKEDTIDLHCVDSLKYEPDGTFDLLFLDTEPHLRFDEFLRYTPFLHPGGYALIHDLHRGLCQNSATINGVECWPFGPLPDEMINMLRTDEYRLTSLPGPRGFAIFYKVHPGDYVAI